MECPYCGAELIQTDTWGYLARHQSGEVLGEIYECPNHDGFENKEEFETFLRETNQLIEDLGVEKWEDACCENAQGTRHYYTDKCGDLHEGYPC